VRWQSHRIMAAAVAAGGALRNGCVCSTPTQRVMFLPKRELG